MRKIASNKRSPNHGSLWLRLILAGILCICVTGLHEANGAQSIPVNKAVTPGDHDVFIPPPASPTDPADITVTITATNCWIIVSQETTTSAGWSGSGPYQHMYLGNPWAGYPQGVFNGKLERDPDCETIPVGGGSGGAEPEEDYTVTSKGSPAGYFSDPPGLTTVCVGEPAKFTAYRWNGDDYVEENSNWTTNGVPHDTGTSITFPAGTSADVYNITATSTSDDTLSDTATLIVVEVVSIDPEPTIACFNSEKVFEVETYPAGHYDKVSVTGSNCTIMAYDTVTGKVTVKFDDVSTHATDYKIVTATCGTSSVQAELIIIKVDLDVGDGSGGGPDGDIDDPEDGVHGFIPGERNGIPVLSWSDGSINPQPLKLVAIAPGMVGVRFEIISVSSHPGFCANTFMPDASSPDYDFGTPFPLASALVVDDKAVTDFYCNDFGGTCRVKFTFYSLMGRI